MVRSMGSNCFHLLRGTSNVGVLLFPIAMQCVSIDVGMLCVGMVLVFVGLDDFWNGYVP